MDLGEYTEASEQFKKALDLKRETYFERDTESLDLSKTLNFMKFVKKLSSKKLVKSNEQFLDDQKNKVDVSKKEEKTRSSMAEKLARRLSSPDKFSNTKRSKSSMLYIPLHQIDEEEEEYTHKKRSKRPSFKQRISGTVLANKSHQAQKIFSAIDFTNMLKGVVETNKNRFTPQKNEGIYKFTSRFERRPSNMNNSFIKKEEDH